mgnify:CR=1 FL=1
MNEKQTLIKKMLEMQKQFSTYEQEHGVDPSEYWDAPEGHPLHQYREKYDELAAKVLELAHGEKGSKR